MPQNFVACDREQELLLPPSAGLVAGGPSGVVRVDAVGEMDLDAFYGAYRVDGVGGRRMIRR